MRTSRRLLAAAIVAVGARLMVAAEMKLPPITGELSGDFKPFETALAPKLHWSAKVRPSGDASGGRSFEVKLDGEGALLSAEVTLATTGQGGWEVTDGTIDLATWLPAVTEKAGGALNGLAANGTVAVKGKGVVREGKPSGVVQLTLREGRVGNAEAGWTLQGVALTAEFLVEAEGIKVKSTTPFELTVATITTTQFGAQNLFVTGVLNADRTVAVSEARIEIAGGAVKIDPTLLTLAPFGLEATLHIVNVGLQDIAALIPQSFASSQGRIDGTLRLGWAAAGGFRVGAGNLSLGQSEAAVVRLSPAPGFLTRSMPKRFEPVPSWAGPLSRWLSADNPVYQEMAEIELGEAPLHVESLTVRLSPEGDEFGRTATVRMKARPTRPDSGVKHVNIDVNVAGPLDSILKLGMNRELSIGVR